MSEAVTNEQGWPVCGNSWHLCEPETRFKLHFAPPEELAKHGGVCAVCHEKFIRNNIGVLRGKVEKPETEFPQIKKPNVDQDRRAFTAFAEVGAICDFDFAAIDESTAKFFDEAPDNVLEQSAEAVALILQWVWSGDDFTAAFRKFAAITAAVRPDILNDSSYKQIGEKLGCTRASISKSALNFQDHFKIKFSRSRSESARANMAAKRLSQNKRRGNQ